MSHPRELLSAFLDGELQAEERLRVEQHMAGCPACADELRELALVDEWARHDEVEAPAGYFDALPGRVRARVRKAVPAQAPARARRAVPQWAWAAAALLLVGLLIPLTLSRRALEAPQGTVATAPLSESTKGPATVREAAPAPTSAPPLRELVEQAPRREADQPAPAETALAKPAAPPAGFAPPPAPAPARQKSADAEALDDLKALGYVDEAKQDGERRSRAAEPAAAAEAESGRAVNRDEAAVHEAIPGTVGGVSGGTTTSTGASAPADQDKRAGEGLRLGGDTRGDTSYRETLNAKRKLEAAPASSPPDEFAALLARSPRNAQDARALRLAWRAFVEAHPGDARADEARLQALEAASLAVRLGGESADRETLERDVQAYLSRQDARQRPRASALVRKDAER